jgi:hypothetical protein
MMRFQFRIPSSEGGVSSIHEVKIRYFMVPWILYFGIRNSDLESQPS